eukprot:gene2803-3096_t
MICTLKAEYKRPHSYLCSVQSSTGITPSHRASVVDNMMAAASILELAVDSLHKAVELLDRYLSVAATPLHLLQPAGIACLWIGAKYEHLSRPRAQSFVYAMILLGHHPGPQLEQLSGHSFEEVKVLVEYLHALHSTLTEARELGTPYTVTVKYSRRETGAVALMAPVVSAVASGAAR